MCQTCWIFSNSCGANTSSYCRCRHSTLQVMGFMRFVMNIDFETQSSNLRLWHQQTSVFADISVLSSQIHNQIEILHKNKSVMSLHSFSV
jgi:hypothetical protein